MQHFALTTRRTQLAKAAGPYELKVLDAEMEVQSALYYLQTLLGDALIVQWSHSSF